MEEFLMPTTGSAIDMPSQPVNCFLGVTIERPWLKARYDLSTNAASGRMLAKTIKGELREYTFEVGFEGRAARTTVSAGVPSADVIEHNGNPGLHEVTGLPQGSREDLVDYARRIGVHLRDLALEKFESAA
jgi:hypothetical protein